MSGSQNEFLSDNTRTAGSAAGRKSATPGSSMNEIIDRAFREPYYRFLLFLAAIWRNWYWALPFSLIFGGILGGVTYYFSKERFTSEAWIRVLMEQPYVVFQQQHDFFQSEVAVQTILQIINSPPVTEDAWMDIAQKANAKGIDISEITKNRNPSKWLADNIHKRRLGESSIYVIGFTTSNKWLSQLIMESILESYIKSIEASNKTRSRIDIRNLEEIAEEQKTTVAGLSRQYDALAAKIAKDGGDLPTELNKLIVASQMSIPTQILNLEAEIAAMQILVDLNQKVLDDEDDGTALPDFEVEATFFRHPVVVQLLTEKVALLDKLEKLTPKYTSEEARDLQNIRKDIDDVQKRIDKAREEFMPDLKRQWKATLRQMAQQEKLATEKRMEQLNKQIEILQEANRKNQTKDESMVKDVNEAMDIVNQRNREQLIYGILKERISRLTTELKAQDQVYRVSEANFPEFPDGYQRLRLSLIVAVLGFVLPVLLAWGRELRNPRFYHLSQFPIMFPGVPRETVSGLSRTGRESDMNRREKDAFYFSVDEICNNFCFGKSFIGSGIFLFSSVYNDDGQTLLALSVAEKIAQMKKKPVLLIDTHGKSSRLRNLVGIEGKSSLEDVLTMRLSINEAIIRDAQQPNLFFLPDGPSSNDSSIDLFSDGTFEMLLKELRNHYSTIIISARPMERASASHLLCHFADEVVLAIRLYNTSRKKTERLYERLYDVGKPVTAFMVSGFSK